VFIKDNVIFFLRKFNQFEVKFQAVWRRENADSVSEKSVSLIIE